MQPFGLGVGDPWDKWLRLQYPHWTFLGHSSACNFELNKLKNRYKKKICIFWSKYSFENYKRSLHRSQMWVWVLTWTDAEIKCQLTQRRFLLQILLLALFPHITDDARSKSHQMNRCIWMKERSIFPIRELTVSWTWADHELTVSAPIFRIQPFWTLSVIYYSVKTQRFGNLISFCFETECEVARTRGGSVLMRKFQTLDNRRGKPVERMSVNLSLGQFYWNLPNNSSCV